jgi:phosphodiesterase/alkaline phosphatase D-like protein
VLNRQRWLRSAPRHNDNPIPAEVKLDDGTIWRNVTIPEKAKVAETLAECRGNYVYNLTQVATY